MNLKKFSGPAILVGIAILLIVVVQAGLGAKYEDGDTLDDGVPQAICCTYLVSILFCLSSIVWFAFALGSKTQKTVFLAQNPNEFQHISVPLASDTQGTVPSTISEDPVAYVREKIVIETSEGDTAQMIGFSMIAGSVGMFVLMVLLGFISILMSLDLDWGSLVERATVPVKPSGVGRIQYVGLNLAFPLWPDCFGKALVLVPFCRGHR